jgi:hypothetical protein
LASYRCLAINCYLSDVEPLTSEKVEDPQEWSIEAFNLFKLWTKNKMLEMRVTEEKENHLYGVKMFYPFDILKEFKSQNVDIGFNQISFSDILCNFKLANWINKSSHC